MPTYVISMEEILWAGFLVAITMAIHGTGMFSILGAIDWLKERFAPIESFVGGLSLVILASLLITLTNLIEVIVWAAFFVLQHAQPNHSVALYNALLNYTTLQAGYLPQRWHLLEAGLGMAGLLTVAWTGPDVRHPPAREGQSLGLRFPGEQRVVDGQRGRRVVEQLPAAAVHQ
ncbi:MAG TPA: hypothetical protein VEN29_07440, partial [Casimicrobiaceae bacterium]|nr:hypothetical protein [Casimicrobiaceae bacterium]